MYDSGAHHHSTWGRARGRFADVCGNKSEGLASVQWLMRGAVSVNKNGEVVIEVGVQQCKI